MTHKYSVGERVCRASLEHPTIKDPNEVLTVMRQMPEDQTGEPSYRVRTEAGERAMREGELVAARR